MSTRREVLAAMAVAFAAGGTGMVPRIFGLADGQSWDRLANALVHPSSLDAQTVRDLRQITEAVSMMERTVESPRLLLPMVTAHLETLTTLVRSAVPSGFHRELCSLTAETAADAGWLLWCLGDFGNSAKAFQNGLRVAEAAGDTALGAYLVGSSACQPFYREDPARRLSWLHGQTRGAATADASPATRAWLYVLEAGGFALLGRGAEFDLCIDNARTYLNQADPSDRRRPRVPFFNRVYLAEEQASGLLRLGRPYEALQALQEVMGDGYGRLEYWLHLDMAKAMLQLGEPEATVESATRALAGARTAEIEPILTYLRELPRQMETTMPGIGQRPAMRDFYEMVREL